MDELLRAGFAALGLPLDAAALARFQTYYTLLDERSKVMNLTAIHGETDVAQLHFLDSAALLTVEPLAGKSVIDVGTGAGFPGLPLKIAQPDISLTLLDSLDKRVRFLGDVCAATGLADVTCLHARAEEAPELRGQFDAAVSRAVARLYLLCELCLPFVRTGGVFLAMKGPDCAEELDEARGAIGKLGGTYERTVRYTIPGTDVTHSVVVILKTAQGSSTVAITTTAGILGLYSAEGSLMSALGLTSPFAAALTVMAIGAGAMTVSHANDSYFWVVTNFGGMKAEDGYKTQTMCTLLMGLASIVFIWIISLFFH